MQRASNSTCVTPPTGTKRPRLTTEEMDVLLSDSEDWSMRTTVSGTSPIVHQADPNKNTVVSGTMDEEDSDIMAMFEVPSYTKTKKGIQVSHFHESTGVNMARTVIGAGAASLSGPATPLVNNPLPKNSFAESTQRNDHETPERIIISSPESAVDTTSPSNEISNKITRFPLPYNIRGEVNKTPYTDESARQKGILKRLSSSNDLDSRQNHLHDSDVKCIDIGEGTSHDLSNEPIMVNAQTRTIYGERFALLTQAPSLCNESTEVNTKVRGPLKRIKIPIRLSKEQENVIELAKQGHNMFYTGSAGTGKSVLLRELIKTLKEMHGPEKVAVTASTGLAACNIGGITVHSFAGIGLGQGDATNLYRKIRRSRKHFKRWETIGVLVIDEVSMLDGDLLDKLDFIAQKIRKNGNVFGGIQLIFCGDFFQLPPVNKDPSNPIKFAFESKAWKDGIELKLLLEKVFRQQGDVKFIDMLNQLRLGKIDLKTELEFKKLDRPLPDDDIIPAELYSTRNEVDRANYSRLNKLPGKTYTYRAIDGGQLQDAELKDKLLQNFLAPKELQLKVGSQVMMIKNIDATLVNGSLGKVIDFMDSQTYMFYETVVQNPEMSQKEFEYYLDNPDILKESLKENNEENDGVVRNRSVKETFCIPGTQSQEIERLSETVFDFLKDIKPNDKEVQANLQRKKELIQQIHISSGSLRKLPLVRFKTSDMSTRAVLVEPEDWAIEDELGKPLVSRVQLPLMLAWALSIHKSQGQTLPKVKVDLKRVFEKGQAYVALSRAVSRDGLQVLNFDRNRIQSHEKVVSFYTSLTNVNNVMQDYHQQSTKAPSKARRSQSTLANFAPNNGQKARRIASDALMKSHARVGGIAELLRKRQNPVNAPKPQETMNQKLFKIERQYAPK